MQTSSEFVSTWECAWRTVSQEGLRALWRGATPAFLGAISENAVCFGVNGHLTRAMASQASVPKTAEPFLAGALTGICTSFALAPFDLIKARAQVSRAVGDRGSRFTVILRHILATKGPAMLYSGIASQVMCSSLFYASFFGSYTLICAELRKLNSVSDSAVYVVAGGLAGQIAWAVGLPLDIVKTRIQVSHENPPRMREVIADVYRTAGVRGFYRGVEATLIRAFPANAALFLAYEWTRRMLGE